ncbi:hypothetical protein [Burkholderia sp. Ac-20365]|uniref:hypothetical protein n=1 Tax=Burkholderia sp. Ac-20365 TaxID=2703897 RepID=UPI00197BCD84|nr:hypothetical protein [Burkholderia sp. Ac-20365]MBN3761232.1 hypothetical protein [Burkholderia sp. Ac-20365]
MKFLCWRLCVPPRTPLMPSVIHRRFIVSRALSAGFILGICIMGVGAFELHIWRATLQPDLRLNAEQVTQAKLAVKIVVAGAALFLSCFVGKLIQWK